MTTIRSLLNPAEEKSGDVLPPPACPLTLREPQPASACSSASGFLQSRKKQKICKDAAVFVRGPIRGKCRFPPHDGHGDALENHHQLFEIYPMGRIADYPRRIPYNSEKKSFLEQTGRECLDVFQYRFKVPGQEVSYSMLWDYNIGLVRTTPLFKCSGYSKTTPAKMLNRNPGLRDICHSITGGALVAQGYWMPYEAAKAIAATFCWNIRYALTPVFGSDFPDSCTRPESERFGEMLIDPEITQRCREEARVFRELEYASSSHQSSGTSSPVTPNELVYPRHLKKPRLKNFQVALSNSAYSTDTSNDDEYTLSPLSPQLFHRNLWTPANMPRSVPRHTSRLPPPSQLFTGLSASTKKRTSDSSSSSELSTPEISPKTRRTVEADEEYDGDTSDEDSVDGPLVCQRPEQCVTTRLSSDEKAAFLLMSMKSLNTEQSRTRAGCKRRASTG